MLLLKIQTMTEGDLGRSSELREMSAKCQNVGKVWPVVGGRPTMSEGNVTQADLSGLARNSGDDKWRLGFQKQNKKREKKGFFIFIFQSAILR